MQPTSISPAFALFGRVLEALRARYGAASVDGFWMDGAQAPHFPRLAAAIRRTFPDAVIVGNGPLVDGTAPAPLRPSPSA